MSILLFFLFVCSVRCSVCSSPIIPPASFHTFIEIVCNLCRMFYKFFQELKWKSLVWKAYKIVGKCTDKISLRGLTEESEQFGVRFDEIHVL